MQWFKSPYMTPQSFALKDSAAQVIGLEYEIEQ